jgi:hypothetical protein
MAHLILDRVVAVLGAISGLLTASSYVVPKAKMAEYNSRLRLFIERERQKFRSQYMIDPNKRHPIENWLTRVFRFLIIGANGYLLYKYFRSVSTWVQYLWGFGVILVIAMAQLLSTIIYVVAMIIAMFFLRFITWTDEGPIRGFFFPCFVVTIIYTFVTKIFSL